MVWLSLQFIWLIISQNEGKLKLLSPIVNKRGRLKAYNFINSTDANGISKDWELPTSKFCDIEFIINLLACHAILFES